MLRSVARIRVSGVLAAVCLFSISATTSLPAPAAAQDVFVSVSLGYFQERLSPFGRWIHHPRWGDVWRPAAGPSFRPYYDGYWDYTREYGWVWISDEPWAPITYHYGRWIFDPFDGWIWVPDYVWGPHWVIWREGGGHIGWFPMPPAYGRYGAGDWYGYRSLYGPSFGLSRFYSLWTFTDARDFGRAGRRHYWHDERRVREVYRHTTETTRRRDHITDQPSAERRLYDDRRAPDGRRGGWRGPLADENARGPERRLGRPDNERARAAPEARDMRPAFTRRPQEDNSRAAERRSQTETRAFLRERERGRAERGDDGDRRAVLRRPPSAAETGGTRAERRQERPPPGSFARQRPQDLPRERRARQDGDDHFSVKGRP